MPTILDLHTTIAKPISIAVIMLSGTAVAQWPTTPDTSITVGPAEATFLGPRQAVATTPDGTTWIAWQDSYCGGFDGGDLRLNAISLQGDLFSPQGAAIQSDPTCGFATPPLIAPLSATNAVAATRDLADLSQFPLNRFDDPANPAWASPFVTQSGIVPQRLAALPSGDLLLASLNFSTIRLDRIAADGTPRATNTIPSPSGANLQIRAIVASPASDHDTSFYLVWDAPTSYTRRAFIQRFDADLNPLWDAPIVPMLQTPLAGISRHTPPTAIATTQGRLVYIWTQGFESGTTPAPIRYQIINPDASLTFPLEGVRLTDSPEREFDPVAVRNQGTGEIDIVYRTGLFDSQAIQAQRLDADGAHLFDDRGVLITPIPVGAPFDAALIRGELHTISPAPAAGQGDATHALNAHQLTDTQGIRGPWPIARADAFFSISAAEADQGLVVTWQQDGPELEDTINATRLNNAGRLGAPPCNRADVTAPYYILDLADIQAFIPAFLDDAPSADLADPSGILDLADVQAFVSAFNAGCF